MARGARPGGRAVSRPGSPALAARRCGLRPARPVRVSGGGGFPVRDPPARQRRAPRTDLAAPHAARGATAALCPTLLRELPLPSAELGPAAPSRREGGVAPRRAVPARWLPRDEPPS